MADPKKLATSFATSTAVPISFLGRHSHAFCILNNNMLYPRKYIIEQGQQFEIVSFLWERPGFSLWGIRVIALFLQFKMNAKIVHKMQSVVESQWVLQIGNDQVSIYQDDMMSLDVSIMKGDDSALMKKIISTFNNSILFKEIKTEHGA